MMEAGAPVDIPADLVEEVALKLLRFTEFDLEEEYAREIIQLVLRRYEAI
jgi:hypothetical protein